MLVRFLSFFIIFSLVSTSSIEAHELDYSDHSDEVSISKNLNTPTAKAIIVQFHCDDCHDDDCEDSADCCRSACGCVSHYYIKVKDRVTYSSIEFLSRVDSLVTNKYRSPFLDPALKPPSFS